LQSAAKLQVAFAKLQVLVAVAVGCKYLIMQFGGVGILEVLFCGMGKLGPCHASIATQILWAEFSHPNIAEK
jgi:hypothetical protein